ncbi:MAG: SUMF1/EgtB/PvdO family nonheme iron enzyme [Verrucomicrobiota bacterium]
MSDYTTPVILSYPDPATTSYLEALLQSYELNVTIQTTETLEDLYALCPTFTDRFIVLCEQFWNESDASDLILSLAMSHPLGAFSIVSSGPVVDFLARDYSLPYIQGLEKGEEIVSIVSALAEDLRGKNLGAYQIRDFAGQSFMGQVYSALQPAIKRDVYLTIPYNNSSPELIESFRLRAAAQGRNSFPSIYAIYEESMVQDRHIISSEPIAGPSLFQFYLQSSTFDDRLLAKIIHTTAAALKHLHDSQIPHPRIKAQHITISERGVIKLHNTALPEGEEIPDPAEELRLLAEVSRAFLDPNTASEPRLVELLDYMDQGSVDLTTAIAIGNQIDIDLAPVKHVPERQRAKEAAKEVVKARQSFWLWAVIGGGAATAFLIFILIFVLNSFVIDQPGTDFLTQKRIPAGKVRIPKTNEMVDVGAFYLDEHEITIGQYEKFLKSTAREDPKKYLPPNYEYSKDNFIPRDWKKIITSVKRKKFYLGEKINRDTPIFNVDYADAYAFAKWAGKRLPTELEWMRAAAGDEHFKLPWGNKPDLTLANTGADRDKTKDGESPGSYDGYRGPAEVNKHSKTDVSPFGVKGMAGNISEWVELSKELGDPKGGDGAQRGGNHGYPVLVSNQKRLNYRKTTQQAWLGFRCASDSAVTAPRL